MNIESISLNFEFGLINDIGILNDFDLYFKIKKMKILYNETINNNKNFIKFFQMLSNFNIENNLTFLDINGELCKENLEINQFECINELKAVTTLKLSNLFFDYLFIIKLTNLEILYINNCAKIVLINDALKNVKELYLIESIIMMNDDHLLELPNVEILELLELDKHIWDEIFDFSYLFKIKRFSIDAKNFFIIKENSALKNIQNLKLYYDEEDPLIFENEENKEIYHSLTELTIWMKNCMENDLLFEDLLIKFPKILTLNLEVANSYFCYCNNKEHGTVIEFINSLDYQIKEINIKGYLGDIYVRINCNFKKLEKININTCHCIAILFPIFYKNCNIFESLTDFTLKYAYLNFEALVNIYHNIDKMPNLKNFTLSCTNNCFNEFLYEKYIDKLSKLKVNNINIDIHSTDGDTVKFKL